MNAKDEQFSILACPETKQQLSLCTRKDAQERMQCEIGPLRGSSSFGMTDQVLLRKDLKAAYPVIDDIPVLMLPEILGPIDQRRDFDLSDPRYEEAYEEMDYYNEVASQEAQEIHKSDCYAVVAPLRDTGELKAPFPEPFGLWVDAAYDCAAQWDAYKHIAPIEEKRVVQLGGKGIHAVKFLLAGASEAWLVTPMIGEARCAIALAKEFGVEERLGCVAAVGEELPFRPDLVDAIYAGGCLHHMETELSLPEAMRILRPGGKFAAVEPWRAPFYAIGTKVFGKREEDVHCRPLTKERLGPLFDTFRESEVIQHGAITRYPLLALSKLGVSSSVRTVWRFNRADDAVASLIPGLRSWGSSVACLGIK